MIDNKGAGIRVKCHFCIGDHYIAYAMANNIYEVFGNGERHEGTNDFIGPTLKYSNIVRVNCDGGFGQLFEAIERPAPNQLPL